MNSINNQRQERTTEEMSFAAKDFGQAANEVYEKALNEAKSQLHPLLRNVELKHLSQRSEFLQAFKIALERRIAQKIAAWQPSVQAVFKYDETQMESVENWDGSIHLLVKVPELSNTVRALARKLDRSLMKCFRQLAWERCHRRQSLLEVHQVTPNELRHRIGYGAMFCAVYNVPVRVWPNEDLQHKR